MELFKRQIGSFAVHIPYCGIAPAFTDLIGGQTHAMFPGLAAGIHHICSGCMRPLAVTGLTLPSAIQGPADTGRIGLQGFRCAAVVWSPGACRHCRTDRKQRNGTLHIVPRATDLQDKLTVEAIESMVMPPNNLQPLSRPTLRAEPNSPRNARSKLTPDFFGKKWL